MSGHFIEDHHVVKEEQRVLDVRPWYTKWAEWLADRDHYAFAAGAIVSSAVVVPMLTPISAVALLGLTAVHRNTKSLLPLRYPAGSAKVDAHTGARPTGILYFGNVVSTSIEARGREAWLADDDLRKHLLILGATGSGKTETLKAICFNALCWSSGFFLCDGKADNKLATEGYSLARKFGVEDNMLYLNFLLGGSTPHQIQNSRRRRSNSLNPFRGSDADTIIQMGANLMPKAEGEGKQWQDKALGYWRAEVAALCYKRDNDGFELSAEVFIEYLALDKAGELYVEGYKLRDPVTGTWPYGYVGIKAYLESGCPGFSVDKLLRKHNIAPDSVQGAASAFSALAASSKPGGNTDQSPDAYTQHSYRANQLLTPLQLLNDTYGHIFRHKFPEINIVDVVLNDRCLMALIPPLEKSPQEAESLGKLAVACLRVMMARNLGTELEGTQEELLDSKATTADYPYPVALDELGYYFADGIAVMFAQARSLGFMMIALAQDLEKLTEGARSSEAGAMMGNQVTKWIMRIDDAKKTWEFVNSVLGKVHVAVRRSFQRAGSNWEESGDASVEMTDRVSLRKLQGLQAGQGILNMQGQSVEIRNMYLGDTLKGNKVYRICHFLQVPPPSQMDVDTYSDAVDEADDPLEKGKRMLAALKGESSVFYSLAPDPIIERMSKTAAKFKASDTPEIRGIALYQAAKAAIEAASASSAAAIRAEESTLQPAAAEDSGIDVHATVDEISEDIPFERKPAQPVLDRLRAGPSNSEAKANPLAALNLLPFEITSPPRSPAQQITKVPATDVPALDQETVPVESSANLDILSIFEVSRAGAMSTAAAEATSSTPEKPTGIAQANDEPAWGAHVLLAFESILAVDDDEVIKVPVDEDGFMIGVAGDVIEKVKTIEQLMQKNGDADFSAAKFEAEIATSVTPPEPVSDAVVAEDQLDQFFDSLEAKF